MGVQIEEIDISRAARAFAAIDLVKAVARLIYVIGAPISAFAFAAWALTGHYELGAALALTAKLWPALFLVLLVGLSYSILSLRPLLATPFVALGAAPAAVLWGQYRLSDNAWGDIALFAGVAAIFAAPLIWAWICVWRLDARGRAMARPAPPMRSPLALTREVFGIWPGLRRSWLGALIATGFSYAATLIGFAGGAVLALWTFLAVVTLSLFWEKQGPLFVVMALVAAWIISALQALLQAGARRFSRASFDQQVKRDARAPILFLRSFQDDQVTLPERGRVAGFFRTLFSLGFGRRRLDHVLIERFSRYGPSLALGSPGEKNLPFGAARVYVDHGDWKAKVNEVAARAAHVVLVADKTPGVEWEIRTFLEIPLRTKTFFVCAPKSADLRDNPVIAERLAAEGVKEGDRPIVAAYWAAENHLVVLRSKTPRGPEAFIVAMQDFFRRAPDEA